MNHLGLAFINLLVLRLFSISNALWAANFADRHGFGLFHKVEVPFAFSLAFTVIFLDWMVYYLHRMYHAIPVFWGIHRVHHTDPEVEVSTGVRFHPLEILLTTLWKGLFIFLLGAPRSSALVYEVLVMVSSLFSHTNARLPKTLENWLRLVLITPDMHRTHHSIEPKETNSNFGFILSFWDRALMTYQSSPAKGQEGLVLGLEVWRAPQNQEIASLLQQPFQDKDGRVKWSNLWRKGRQGAFTKAGSQ
jgi:sterol desaturase/sphingolipid hydroxylase (fatty acid hydroxylase superfamily)